MNDNIYYSVLVNGQHTGFYCQCFAKTKRFVEQLKVQYPDANVFVTHQTIGG